MSTLHSAEPPAPALASRQETALPLRMLLSCPLEVSTSLARRMHLKAKRDTEGGEGVLTPQGRLSGHLSEALIIVSALGLAMSCGFRPSTESLR